MGRGITTGWIAVAAVLAAAWAGGAVASPVLDDEALVRGFGRKLGDLADAGTAIEAAAARQQLETQAGKTAAPPASAAGRALVPAGPLYDAVLPAVVAVGSVFKCDRCSQWHVGGMASGWIVSPDGLVVTNHHVLQREAGHCFGVMTSDGEVYAVTEVVAADPDGDAAVVRIDGRGREFSCLALGAAPDCGTPVSVISHPKGRFYCLTEGVVSRYHRLRRRDPGQPPGRPAVWMSVTADYAVGSSGGPVFDAAGRVVGMVSRTSTVMVKPGPGGAAASAPAAGGDPATPGGGAGPVPPGPPHEQMIFKDCVSADTLRAVLGGARAAAGAAGP